MRAIFLTLIIFLTGCGSNDLPQYSKLDRLRVLAITTPTPEVQNPAAGVLNVDVTPYLSDVDGSGDLTLIFQTCLDPGTSLGAPPSCEGAPLASALQTVTVNAPAGQADGVFGTPERTGAPSSGAINLGLNIPPGFLDGYTDSLKNNGIPFLITMNVASASGSIRAFRRILISNKTANTNPVISDLFQNNASITVFPTSEVELSFSSSSTPETYSLLSAEGAMTQQTEVFETTWFTANGEILNPRTKSGETTKWDPAGTSPAGRKGIIAGVLRDGRGGASVLIRTLN